MYEPEVPAHVPWRGHARVSAQPKMALTDEGAVTSYYAGLPPLWASVHLVGGFAMSPVTETGLADFEKMHTLNAVTSFLCCREAVRSIRTRAGSPGAVPGGRLVNVAARPVVAPAGGMVAYTTAKAAVASLTQCLADELRDESILANAVVPSIIDTPANRKSMPSADHAGVAQAGRGRRGDRVPGVAGQPADLGRAGPGLRPGVAAAG